MQKIELLMSALEYIEIHLSDDLKTEDDDSRKDTIHAAQTSYPGYRSKIRIQHSRILCTCI